MKVYVMPPEQLSLVSFRLRGFVWVDWFALFLGAICYFSIKSGLVHAFAAVTVVK